MNKEAYARLNIDMIIWTSIFKYLEKRSNLKFLIYLTTISKQFNKWIHAVIDWKKEYDKEFGITPTIFSALENLSEIVEIPMSIWKQEYIFSYLAMNMKCSFCQRSGGFTQGEFYTQRRVSLCQQCWMKYVLDSDKVNEIMNRSFPDEKLENLEDIDITICPSFYLNKRPCFLKYDVENFITLVGGTPSKKEKGWRSILKQELIKKGVNDELASYHAYMSFPEDGTKISDVVSDIITRLGNISLEEDNNKITESDQSEQKARSTALYNMLERHGIDKSVTEVIPYRTVIQEYINGKDLYTLEQIIELIKQSESKRNSLMAALDSVKV